MELWNQDAMELAGPAIIEFGSDDTGSFRFIAIKAWMDVRHADRSGRLICPAEPKRCHILSRIRQPRGTPVISNDLDRLPVKMVGTFRVVFWNRLHAVGAARTVEYLATKVSNWDAALLVECTDSFIRAARARFGSDNVISALDWHRPEQQKPNGAAIIVGPDAHARSGQLTFSLSTEPNSPRPERSVTVVMETGAGTITLLATHVMNTHDGYERKMTTYRGLSNLLGATPGSVVIGLDGNNWYDWIGSGGRADPRSGPRNHAEATAFHDREPAHRLRDTLRVAIERDPERRRLAEAHLGQWGVLAATHRRVNALDRMDRIYASPDIGVAAAGVDAGAFDRSDHALVWADLTPGNPEPRWSAGTIKEPVVAPKPRRGSASPARQPDTLRELVDRLVLAERYGWNRRGYLARVALASAVGQGADEEFVRDHYRWTERPSARYNPTRNALNKSWARLGGHRFGSAGLIGFDRRNRRHTMPREIATLIVEILGISDLCEQLGREDLEDELRKRFEPLVEAQVDH